MKSDGELRETSSARRALLRDKKSVIDSYTPSETDYESITNSPEQHDRIMSGENEAGRLLQDEPDVEPFSSSDELGRKYAADSIEDVLGSPERMRSYFFSGESACVSRLSNSEFGLLNQLFNSLVVAFALGIPILLFLSIDATVLIPLALVGAAFATFGFEFGHRYLSYGRPVVIKDADDEDEEYDPWSLVTILMFVQLLSFAVVISLSGFTAGLLGTVLLAPVYGPIVLLSLYSGSRFINAAWKTAYPEDAPRSTKIPSLVTFFAVAGAAAFVVGLLAIMFEPLAGSALLGGMLIILVGGVLLAGVVLLIQHVLVGS